MNHTTKEQNSIEVMDTRFKQYRRTGLSEMRPYEQGDWADASISFSKEDTKLSTLLGGYVARNPENHKDQWYVAKKYFEENLEEATVTEPIKEEELLDKFKEAQFDGCVRCDDWWDEKENHAIKCIEIAKQYAQSKLNSIEDKEMDWTKIEDDFFQWYLKQDTIVTPKGFFEWIKSYLTKK